LPWTSSSKDHRMGQQLQVNFPVCRTLEFTHDVLK
jgi:hypothetical protein